MPKIEFKIVTPDVPPFVMVDAPIVSLKGGSDTRIMLSALTEEQLIELADDWKRNLIGLWKEQKAGRAGNFD